jgi:O6-methylguanine-DNA--protein-cysteine methyltransferase
MSNIAREKHVNHIGENLVRSTIKDRDVYDLLLKIPAGKVFTYGDLAKALTKKNSFRNRSYRSCRK